MQKTILILGCLFISFVSFGYTSSEYNTKSKSGLNILTDEIYPIVAKTNNGRFGTDYSIGAEVHASEFLGKYTVKKVVVRGQSISFKYNYIGSMKGTYQFYYNGETYYFYF